MRQLNLTGKNVILYDDLEKESIMVRIPKFRLSEVIDGAPDLIHPAFLVDGKEKECIYISKYQSSENKSLWQKLKDKGSYPLLSNEAFKTPFLVYMLRSNKC